MTLKCSPGTGGLAAGLATAALLCVAVCPAAAQPAQPLAPPIEQPGSGDGRCQPPATTVVAAVPWAQKRLAPQRVWPLTKGAGILVAVIDSGVDAKVRQLAGAVTAGLDLASYRPGTERLDPAANTDCLGHGTLVAGIIAARPVPGVGFAGVAPESRILPIRQTSNGADGSAAGLATAIRAAVDRGATVVNISTATFHSTEELRAAVEYAAAKDVLIVAAAANQAEQGNPAAYPAAYPSVVAVAAVGQDGDRSAFSETGDYISLAAPGTDVLSTGPRGNGHFVGRGTSYAAPFVTGVAALVRAAHPGLSAAQVKHRLQQTADHPPAALPDQRLGWGVVNPLLAVTAVLPGERGATTQAAPPVRLAAPLPAPGLGAADLLGRLIAGGALALVCAALVVKATLARGRRRGWRSAGHGEPVAGKEIR